jgi:FkbM family methyltransferase
MIRNSLVLKYLFCIKPKTVIHIGAHYGQDRSNYINLGAKKIFWGEASPDCAKKLRNRFPNDVVIEKIFWDVSNKSISFYEFDETAKNSAITPKNIDEVRQSDGTTITLDDAFKDTNIESPVMLVLDVQGGELHVLNGAKNILRQIDYFVVEIANGNQGYVETPQETDIDTLTELSGFKKSIYRTSHDGSYKDQLYIKKNLMSMVIISIIDFLLSKIRNFVHLIRFKHHPRSNHSCLICDQ